jgi:glycosyltransferase involved in cell wall biosynthesis
LATPDPAITLVVPTLDSHHLLPRLVGSLQQQTWKHWRLLFIDGPSGPDHRAWLDDLCRRDGRCEWQPQRPGEPGIFGAMNQGFAAAEPGHWLLFWGSDDWAAEATVLEQVVETIRQEGDRGRAPDLLVGIGRYADADTGALGRRSVFRWRHSYRRSLFLGSTPPHQATVIGPGARAHLNRFASDFQLAADLDYFLRLSCVPGLTVRLLDRELVHMATGGASGRQTRRRLAEVRRAYGHAFGALWWFPYLMRYGQRLQSLWPT